MAGGSFLKTTTLVIAMLAVAGCEDGAPFPFLEAGPPDASEASGVGAEAAVRTVEKDVEAPDVFAVNEPGLWDGRPSLGGVWVAHPEVGTPERVLIRNPASDKTVVGGLYRREVNTPGPRIQVSSEAAAALGMLAGQPTVLDVVALRREEVVVEEAPAPIPTAGDGAPPLATDGIESSSLDAVATAAAAIEAAEATETTAAIEPSPSTAAAPAAPQTSNLRKPFVQIGIFNVEENANNAATSLRGSGMVPTVRAQESSGKPFWRVVVGPATTTAERRDILAKVRDLGYTDAYFVSN